LRAALMPTSKSGSEVAVREEKSATEQFPQAHSTRECFGCTRDANTARNDDDRRSEEL
jgi:hypothetical protein